MGYEQFIKGENLSIRNTTIIKQSSTYNDNGATLANDGNLDLKEESCSHTDLNQPQAWLQVDLGKPYRISNVKIYYRSDDSWTQYRFRQFYLDVSEFPATTSTTSQRTRCYTDNTAYPDIPPNIIDKPCKQTARYVIVETTYDAPEDNPIKGAFLEICEIEIYGCETGTYGDNCRPCVGCQTCDIKSGRCDCLDTCNYQVCNKSRHCLFGCQTGYWDYTCSSTCSENCLNRHCSITNGTCGTCISGRYGDTCDGMCSPRCLSESCDRQSGACSDGCRPNWAGKHCETCDSSHYGPTCSDTCSINCTNGCRPDNGDCYGCVEGLFGPKCDETCGPGCVSGCDQITGHCTCRQGWQMDNCVECSPNYYGALCNKRCSPKCNHGTCFANNGTCDSGCKCNIIDELNAQVQHVQNSNNQHFLYAVSVLFCLSLMINLFVTISCFKNNTCKCKRERSRQNEIRCRPSTNEDIQGPIIYESAEMETDYENLSELRRSHHHYEHVW